MSGKVDTPLKWLLAELPAFIEPAPLARLMERFRLHKTAYERQIKVNKIERIVRVHEKRNSPDDAAKLARWRQKLAKLRKDMV